MIDADFVSRLQELDAKGKDGLPEMRELLRPAGQLSRLIALAARGAHRAKRAPKGPAGTFLPDNFPGDAERERAVAYWRKHGRPDLEARIEEQIDKFRGLNADKQQRSWPGKWATFFMNAIDFTRPAFGTGAGAPVLIELASVDGWLDRLSMFYGHKDGCPAGAWHPKKWGPKPGDPGCRVPPEAQQVFDSRNVRQARK